MLTGNFQGTGQGPAGPRSTDAVARLVWAPHIAPTPPEDPDLDTYRRYPGGVGGSSRTGLRRAQPVDHWSAGSCGGVYSAAHPDTLFLVGCTELQACDQLHLNAQRNTVLNVYSQHYYFVGEKITYFSYVMAVSISTNATLWVTDTAVQFALPLGNLNRSASSAA
jgi:hypothetical protein